ncbi:AAA family ATPase [Saccharopolyspora sp. NFXS83]|uniref:AAA family ATPase n=1 Tax=Saccharopolyspora sp. NFXS83 TaxID=2993560 RepID=UPI00224AB27F|nr:AAA family ATPase [Saccharopolyspora sp. NFXS83]MCX2732428.1 AAA family ATPase [Saccharopolyspora sp. NFXS83]
MAGLDDDVGLVGRETTAELIDHLVLHVRDRPMPIVVLHGAGGVGKTAVIEHVERRYDKAVPMARVDFDEPRSKSTWDVLEAVYRQLGAESHREFGRLVLPRYELARTVHATLRSPEHGPVAEGEAERGEPAEVATSAQRRRQVREQLARRLASVELMTDVVGEAGDSAPAPVAGLLLRMARPVLHRLTAIGVGAPRWARWLLAGPRSAAALSWFEAAAAEPQHFEGISDRVRIDDVVLHIQGRFESSDARAAESADKWHRLALAALLADLRAAYLRRRTRTVNCVLLLDDADLLSPDKAERVALSTPPTEPGGDPDFLDLLAEAMRADPRIPLLVVATKQSGAPAGAAVEPAAPGTDPERTWRRRYDEWAEQFRGDGPRTPELPVQLTNFGLEDTRRFFIERSRSEEATVLSERYVRELHCATHGHPLALTLVSDRIDWSFRRDRRVPSARSTLGMRVPPGLRGADLEDTVRGYLLMRMLHRFRTNAPSEDEDVDDGVRDRTVTLFAKLAAPLLLDEPVVRLLAGDRGSGGVRQITEALDILSFVRPGPVEPGGNRTWTLDPLLRDLLVRELLDRSDHSYEQVHRDLAEHYESIERHDPAAYLRAQYHRLALGEVGRVAKVLANRAGSGDVSWQRDLARVLAWAPVAVFRRPYQVRDLVQRAWSPVARGESAEAIADLLRAVQALCSCTVVGPWDDKAFAEVARAQREAPGTVGVDLGKWNSAFARLRPLNSQDERGLPDSSAANRKFGYPVVWPRRGTIPRFTAVALVLALVGYGSAFAVHSVWDCDEDGSPWDVAGIGRSALRDPLRLTKAGTQCIGVTDRPSSFTAAAEEPSAATEEIAALTAEAVAENGRVAREKDPHRRRPLVKIVVATMLSSTQEGERRELAVGVNELRGAVLAQREWNGGELVDKHTPDVKVQLLFANLGGSSEHAFDVAGAVRALAKRDPSIVAVTGLGQSRTTTVDAVERLGAPPDDAGAPVPMIASAASGTALTGKPWFFRIAATNQRQAEVAVRYGSEEFPDRAVHVLRDDDDAYSEDLSTWQINELVARKKWPDIKRFTPSSDSLSTRIEEICGQDRPLIYYSGRANDFPVMLNKLKDVDCAERAVVIAGDDLTQFANGEWEDANSVPGGYPPERLFFTSLGPSAPAPGDPGWAQGLCDGPEPIRGHQRCRFFVSYERLEAEPSPHIAGTGPNGHVLVAYDAVHLALRSAERAQGAEGAAVPSRRGVLEELRGTSGSEAFAGTAGLVDFGVPSPGRGGADPQRKLIVVQSIDIAGDEVAGAEVVDHDGQP